MLLLEQVEIFKNDRGKAAQSGDIDTIFLGKLHGAEHLAASSFKPAQHFWHEAGVDVGPFYGLACGAGDLKMLHQLGRGTTPNIEVTFGKLLKAKSASLFTGSLETCGVTDQAEHGQP